jgi:hypothetical protein
LTSALALSFGALAAALLIPGIRHLLGVVPIGPIDALLTLAAGVLPYFLNEALKTGRHSCPGHRPGFRSEIGEPSRD